MIGADFVAEIAPMELESEIAWHYELYPEKTDVDLLQDRAAELRARAASGSGSGE